MKTQLFPLPFQFKYWGNKKLSSYIQGDQLITYHSFWNDDNNNLQIRQLSSPSVKQSRGHFLQGAKKTRPCLSGRVVLDLFY